MYIHTDTHAHLYTYIYINVEIRACTNKIDFGITSKNNEFRLNKKGKSCSSNRLWNISQNKEDNVIQIIGVPEFRNLTLPFFTNR